jgi:hypothetical protein
VGVRRADDAGAFQAAVADDPAGPWLDLGSNYDTNAPVSEFAEVPLGKLEVRTPGQKLFRFSASGMPAGSRSFHLYLDYIRVKKSE